jgi:hypothetical protein
MKKIIGITLLVFVCLLCFGAGTASRLVFKTTGFSIHPLETDPLGHSYQAMSMFLPPSIGFSPNVNVQVQCYKGTIEEYIATSKKELASMEWKVVKSTKQEQNSYLMEYTGEFQGNKLHWYAKATATGKRVYLATATAKEKQWADVGVKLKACVDSLEVKKEK